MSETIRIFSGYTTIGGATYSDVFRDATFLYMIAPDSTYEVEVDAFLQLIISGSIKRLIRLENLNIVNTEACSLIPLQYRHTNLEMQLAMYFSHVEYIELYIVKSDCCAQEQLNRIETNVNLGNAIKVIDTVIDVVSQGIISGIASTVSSILLPAAVRKGFTIFNPTEQPVFIDYNEVVDTSAYAFRLDSAYPFHQEMTGYSGAISAISSSEDVQLKVREFR